MYSTCGTHLVSTFGEHCICLDSKELGLSSDRGENKLQHRATRRGAAGDGHISLTAV